MSINSYLFNFHLKDHLKESYPCSYFSQKKKNHVIIVICEVDGDDNIKETRLQSFDRTAPRDVADEANDRRACSLAYSLSFFTNTKSGKHEATLSISKRTYERGQASEDAGPTLSPRARLCESCWTLLKRTIVPGHLRVDNTISSRAWVPSHSSACCEGWSTARFVPLALVACGGPIRCGFVGCVACESTNRFGTMALIGQWCSQLSCFWSLKKKKQNNYYCNYYSSSCVFFSIFCHHAIG